MGIHDQVRSETVSKCDFQHTDTLPHVVTNSGIHEQVWISIVWYMNKFGFQHVDKREHQYRLWIERFMTKCKYQYWYTLPSENINRDTWRSANINTEYITNCEYQYEDTCQVSLATQFYVTKCNINTVIHDQVWVSTWVYMTKYDSQHWDTWPNVNINMGTHEQEIKCTWGCMTKCKYYQVT